MRPGFVRIERPRCIMAAPGNLGPKVHEEIERYGQRFVFDWMLDLDAGRPVLRVVNMTTGVVAWFRPPDSLGAA